MPVEVPNDVWALGVSIPMSAILADVDALGVTTTVLAVVGLLIAFGLTLLVARGIAKAGNYVGGAFDGDEQRLGAPARRRRDHVDLRPAGPSQRVLQRPVTGRRDAAAALVAVPPDIEDLRARDRATAQTWRVAVRDALLGLAANGAHITGVDPAGWYVLGRPHTEEMIA